jgi:hypothetical protein
MNEIAINKFKNAIKKLIKEEVDVQVNKKIEAFLSEMVKGKNIQLVFGGESAAPLIKPFVATPPKASAVNIHEKKKIYTKNAILNDILNETINDLPVDPVVEHSENPPVPNGTLKEESNNNKKMLLGNGGSKLDFLKSIISESAPVSPRPTSITETSNVSPELKKVFNKNFRDIMKAIDEKKKNGVFGMGANVSLS